MKTIKFSNEYNKMFNNVAEAVPKTALLLEVFLVDSKDLHPRFIEYDTAFTDPVTNKIGYYKLPKGKVIVLLLRSAKFEGSMIWTTIRRYTPNKYDYYRKLRWEMFKIEIN